MLGRFHLDTPLSQSFSLRQFICWCMFRGECCYGGPADACQSILARKPQRLSGGVRARNLVFGGRREPGRLSFTPLCPWACQLLLYACVCVFMWGHDGFSYQFMGDYMDSFHSSFWPWIFYHHINKKQFQGRYACVGNGRGPRGAVAVFHGYFYQQKWLLRCWKMYLSWIWLKGDFCAGYSSTLSQTWH